MKYLQYSITFILLLFIHLSIYAQCPYNNVFTGNTDGDWSTASNWSTGCVPTSPIDGQITIKSNCTISSGTVGYTFSSSSRLQIDAAVTLTNNSSNPFTFNGEITGEGTYYVSDMVVGNGNISPGDMLVPAWTCGEPIVYGGQSYATLQKGGQCWMAENLNIGARIDGTTTMKDNGILEKYCYNDETAACDEYGALYQWNEMMQYVTEESTQGICPDGWHIPSDAEWMTFEEELGMCSGVGSGCSGSTGFRGTDQGSQLAGNIVLWNDGDLEQDAAFGTSGFNALPGGYRHSDGSFNQEFTHSYFWTTTPSSSKAWRRSIYYNETGVDRNRINKFYGFPVRCVKD